MPSLAELVPGRKYIVYKRHTANPNEKVHEGTFVETAPLIGSIVTVKLSDATFYHPTNGPVHSETTHVYYDTSNPQFTFVEAPAEGGRRQRRRRTTRRRTTRRHRSRRH